MEKKKIYKSSTDRFLSGVLGGLAEYLNMDSTLVRLIYVALCLFTTGFPGLILYIIAAIIIPESPTTIE